MKRQMGEFTDASRGLALSVCALLAASSAAAADESAATGHFFPLIADGDGFQSRLVLTNVADAANQCALSLRGPGLDAGIFQADPALTPTASGAEIHLDGAGDSAMLTSARGEMLTFGFAKLDCAEPVAARALLSLRNRGTLISVTNLESAKPGRSFQFPALRRLGGLAMVFSNAGGLDSACAVELEDETGASIGGGNVAVPAGSTALSFLDELVGNANSVAAGKVRIACSREVAALALPLRGAVFTALTPTMLEDDNAKSSHIVPLIQDGGGFRSHLLLTNLAEAGNSCVIHLRGDAAQKRTGFEFSNGAKAADANFTVEFDAKGDQASLLSGGPGGLSHGYAVVECDGPAQARNLLTVDAGNGITGMAAIPSAQPADAMEFPIVRGFGQPALILSNDTEAEASCTIELSANGNAISGAEPFTVASRSTRYQFIIDLIPLPGDFREGMARLSCDRPIAAVSLSDYWEVFAALPPTIRSFNTVPTFKEWSGPDYPNYVAGTAISALRLPEAFGGDGELTYSLSPQVPGLVFDAALRQLGGTPTAAGAYTMTYTVRDAAGNTAIFDFTINVLPDNARDHLAALTAGLPERPFLNTTVGGTEGSTQTVGTLRLTLNPLVFPVIEGGGQTGPLVAASHLGAGRVVALPGQDFLSPGDRATLLGNANAVRLLANAVRWAGADRAEPLRVLVDNQRIADALAARGIDGVEVVGALGADARDWSAATLAEIDVAVVLANGWGTAHLLEDSVAPLRAFAERGGGLVVAASALHWHWWLESRHGPLTANSLLRGTGISWKEDSVEEIASAATASGFRLRPHFVWSEYIGGGALDEAQLAMLPEVMREALELGRTGEVDSALDRLARETPALPTLGTAPAAAFAAAVAETLGPHEWPETHPWAADFPGLPAADAVRINATVTVDATWSEFPDNARRGERHIPLGFYAPPGALVTLEVPSGHATGELGVSVGELHDDLRQGYATQRIWRRAPQLRREFQIASGRTGITNAYGGSIALIVPAHYAGVIPITVRGAIPMAVYTAGESNAADWRAALDAGAPQAIIQKPGGIRLVISVENARGIDDPGEVAAFWDGFYRSHAELSGEPARAFESIWIFDPQVGWGYANASPLRINFPLHAETWALVPGSGAGRAWIAQLPSEGPKPFVAPPPSDYDPWLHGVDWWLFGHELGHQWQNDDWGYGPTSDIVEVAVNLFTMHTENFYLYGGGDKTLINGHESVPGTVNHAALALLSWPTAGYFEKLSMYRQLVAEFGWNAMKAVFHSYYDAAYPRATYGEHFDGFAIRFSAVVERDLVGFFQRWGYPLSDSAAATIRGFGHQQWLPPGW